MKNLLNLGKALNKAEQKNVIGGGIPFRREGDECDTATVYMTDCPFPTSNSDGGCWVSETTCSGGNN